MYKNKAMHSGLKKKTRRGLLMLSLLACIGYFAYHAISGERGFLALVHYTQLLHEAQASLDVAKAEQLALEHRVNSLRSESLDLDLLDEQARWQLGMSGKGENVYVLQ